MLYVICSVSVAKSIRGCLRVSLKSRIDAADLIKNTLAHGMATAGCSSICQAVDEYVPACKRPQRRIGHRSKLKAADANGLRTSVTAIIVTAEAKRAKKGTVTTIYSSSPSIDVILNLPFCLFSPCGFPAPSDSNRRVTSHARSAPCLVDCLFFVGCHRALPCCLRRLL